MRFMCLFAPNQVIIEALTNLLIPAIKKVIKTQNGV